MELRVQYDSMTLSTSRRVLSARAGGELTSVTASAFMRNVEYQQKDFRLRMCPSSGAPPSIVSCQRSLVLSGRKGWPATGMESFNSYQRTTTPTWFTFISASTFDVHVHGTSRLAPSCRSLAFRQKACEHVVPHVNSFSEARPARPSQVPDLAGPAFARPALARDMDPLLARIDTTGLHQHGPDSLTQTPDRVRLHNADDAHLDVELLTDPIPNFHGNQ